MLKFPIFPLYVCDAEQNQDNLIESRKVRCGPAVREENDEYRVREKNY